MFDFHTEQRKAMLKQMSDAADNTIEAQRKRAIEALGERWIFHPKHAPQRGSYNPLTGRRLA